MANIKIIRSEKLSTPTEDRYVIVDAETGEVLNDSQGYGFKSEKAAQTAWNFKKGFYYNRERMNSLSDHYAYTTKPNLRR